MSNPNHPWCRDTARDEAVRAAEDAANWRLLEMGEVIEEGDEYESQAFKRWERVPKLCVGKPIHSYLPHRRRRAPSIQHRDLPEQVALLWASLGDILGRVVRLEGEMDAGQAEAEEATPACAPASPADGLRTERVTLEFHIEGPPPTQWPWSYILNRSDAIKMRPGESVRVVEDATIGSGDVFADVGCGSTGDEVARLTAERDAAHAEAERLKAQIVALEGHSRMDIEREIAVEEAWERCGITPHWPDDEAGSSQRYAASMEAEIGRLRARVAELEAAAKTTALLAEMRESEWNVASKLAAEANAENAGGGNQLIGLSPAERDGLQGIADGVRRYAHGFIVTAISDAARAVDSVLARHSLAAPPEPRGWLTAEERAWLKETLGQCRKNRDARLDEGNVEGAKLVGETCETLTALLARESPPRVKVPPKHAAWWELLIARDGQWRDAIREAGGEVAE